jgi:hypothetical protein
MTLRGREWIQEGRRGIGEEGMQIREGGINEVGKGRRIGRERSQRGERQEFGEEGEGRGENGDSDR